MLVVRAAAQLDVLDGGGAAHREWRYVMELEERRLSTPARPSDERAALLIALPHGTPDGRRYVTSRCSTVASAWLRRRDTGKPSSLEIVDQQRQRAIENRADVTIRQRVSGKRLRVAQLFVGLASQRHLQLVVFRRERRHDGGAALRCWRRSDFVTTRRRMQSSRR